MLPKFGFLLRLFANRYFNRVRVERDDVERLSALHKEGTVVYVLPSTSVLDTLVLNHIFLREKLPVARTLGGIGLLAVWPLLRVALYGLRRLLPGRAAALPPLLEFEESLRAGGPALLYVKRPTQFIFGGKHILKPYLEVLLKVQAEQERPIFLVPQLIVWRNLPARPNPTLMDQVFGDPDAPGAVRKMFNFMRLSRLAFLQVGEVIEARGFLGEAPDDADPADAVVRASGQLNAELFRRFDIERRVISGPTLKRARQVKEEILRNPDFDQLLYDLSARLGRPIGEVRRQAARCLDEIAADFSMNVIDFFCLLLSLIFQRIFSGLHVDKEGLNRVRDAARKGTLIFLPCHRSHVDYLVISYVLYSQGMVPPHIAAGANLDYFPIGSLFRRSGAFFLRRSFRDDPLYAATFSAYLRKLVKEGVPIEAFIEGGRSRTGKNLPPKFGVLKEIVAAHVAGAAPDLMLVPVGISYERILEDASYRRELMGAEKEKESLGALLKTPRFLITRYGRLTVTFGEPIAVASEVERHAPALAELSSSEVPVSASVTREDATLPRFVKHLAYKVLKGINDVILATPTALLAWALLAHPRPGVRRRELVTRVGFLLDHLQAADVPLAPTLRAALAVGSEAIGERRDAVEASIARGDPDLEADAPGAEYGPWAPVYEATGDAVTPLIDEAFKLFEQFKAIHQERFDDTTVYRVRAEERIRVDNYKNTILHALVRECLLATAVLRSMGEEARVRRSAVEEDCAILSRLLKYELTYDPELPFDRSFEETWARFVEQGWLVGDGEEVEVPAARRPLLRFFRFGLMNFMESYALAADRALALTEPTTEKDFVMSVAHEGKKRHAVGELLCVEACSTATIRNATRYLTELGALRRKTVGRKTMLEPSTADGRAALDHLIAHLEAWRRAD